MVSIADIDAYQGGSSTADFAVKVANSARNFACGLYKNYPSSIMPNPIDNFVRGFWDGLCENSDDGLPTPPAPPFSGGQCPGIAYRVDCDWDFYFNNVFQETKTFSTSLVLGKVETVALGNPIPGKSSVGAYVIFRRSDGTADQADAGFGFVPNYEARNLRNIVVTPQTPGTDTCGDPPEEWPDKTTIPPGGNSGTINIDLGDTTTIQLDVTVPIPTGGINFAPKIAIASPNISVIADVDLNFDFGGLRFDGGSNPPTLDDINELRDRIDNDRKIPAQPPNADTHDIDPPDPDGDGDKKSDLANLDYVKVTLTTIPTSARVQFGNGSSPNVYVGAGWLHFTSGDFSYPRENVNFEEGYFKAPEGADGFAYTLAVGYQGNAVSYRRKSTT